MLHAPLPLLPPKAEAVNSKLAVLLDEERLVVFNASGQIYTCSRDDAGGMRLAAAMFTSMGLAKPTELARALQMHPTTVFRSRQRLSRGGVTAVQTRKLGPKRASKLTPEVCARAQRCLDEGHSIRRVANEIGVVEGTLRHAVGRGLLRVQAQRRGSAGARAEELPGPAERAEHDQAAELGVATKRVSERAAARLGKLEEAAPKFESAQGVAGAGALLALPALLDEGLLDEGISVYGSLRSGFFGLRSILLTFAFMALLRIKSPEQLTEHAPGELGRLLGLDRVPEVKTLRRKLAELGERSLARKLTQNLTERWARAEPKELALLYVDGHVRPYHGRKHTLAKHHVQQRGRPMPGTKDFHVNDRRAEPLFFVTAEATEGLLSTLDNRLLPEARRLVGPTRRVTVAFDREGWSPELFAKWKDDGFDVLTYRKGKQSRWQERFFTEVEGKVGGAKVKYRLAEREVTLTGGLRVREIRRLSEDGHQTSVITTNERLPLLSVAHRMFSRWKQENFFRYMRHEFALDHLCTNGVEPADPKRMVKPPERAELEKQLKAARAAYTKLLTARMKLAPGKRARVGGKALDEDELDRLLMKREAEVTKLSERLDSVPKTVPLDTVLPAHEIVALEQERKVLVDAIKLTAYRAESSLCRLVAPLLARHEDEGRKLLKTIFRATADIIPDEAGGTLTVRFHGLASPRATRALYELCALLNREPRVYPGTDLRLQFDAPAVQRSLR